MAILSLLGGVGGAAVFFAALLTFVGLRAILVVRFAAHRFLLGLVVARQAGRSPRLPAFAVSAGCAPAATRPLRGGCGTRPRRVASLPAAPHSGPVRAR